MPWNTVRMGKMNELDPTLGLRGPELLAGNLGEEVLPGGVAGFPEGEALRCG